MRYLFRQFVTAPLGDLACRPPGQVPGLDVLRTFAVLVVLWGHTAVSYFDFGGEQPLVSKLAPPGWIGVDLFFVLSGYLIGKQLWREWGREGTIDFWRFFLRRGFRIWPLYFFFLAFVTLVLGHGDLPFGRGWSDAVFLTNYFNQGVVIGSWSLCTEEQFYLAAPLLLIISARWVRSLRQYRRYLWFGFFALPVIRALTWWWIAGDFSHHNPELFKRYLYGPIHSHCDGLLMGLILANLGSERRDAGGATSQSLGLLLAILGCGAMFALRALQREVFNFTGLTLFLGAIVSLALRDGTVFAGFVRARPFYLVSRLSYGMYLNHAYLHGRLTELAVTYVPGFRGAPSLHFVATQCLVAMVSVLFATVTFCVIEHPFLRLRDELLRRSAATKDSINRAMADAAEPAVVAIDGDLLVSRVGP